MSNPQPSKFRAGFTLVELLIVVIILAILAAIVIPQFSSATRDTQEAALDANLASVRNAVELYKVQHGFFPGDKATSGGAGCAAPATPGTAAAGGDEAAFTESLTMYSNKAGQTCSAQSDVYRYGPYIRQTMPIDPVTESKVVAVTATGAPIVPGAPTGGWAFDTKSGQFVMNSNAADGRTATSLYYQR